MAQAKTAVVDTSSVQIRFEPMGPDVYGQNQPQELLAAIAEDVEPLKDLVDQHVVSIQPFRPEVLLQVCLLYTSPSPRDYAASRMPSSA